MLHVQNALGSKVFIMSSRIYIFLVFIHISIICVSNVLVLYPLTVFGYASTYGAFVYPLIFIVTDLTTRLLGAPIARQTVFRAFLPGLILSFFVSSWVQFHSLSVHINLPLRVAFAGITAYVLGQLLDIICFQPFRTRYSWWIAPTVAGFIGNIVDTFTFFFIAFYACSDPFLSANWFNIAVMDLLIKILFTQVMFIPLYGLCLYVGSTFLWFGEENGMIIRRLR